MIIDIATDITDFLNSYTLPDSITGLSNVPALFVFDDEDAFSDHNTPGICLCGYVGDTTPQGYSDGVRTTEVETDIVIECKIVSPQGIAKTIANIMQQEVYTMIHSGALAEYHFKFRSIPKPSIDKTRASIGIVAYVEHTLEA
jgi:hypothetical protein